MRDMRSMVGDVDRLREERDARKNPPEFEIGQGDEVDWSFMDELDNSSGSSNSMLDSAFGGSDFSSLGLDSSFSNLGGSFQNSVQGVGTPPVQQVNTDFEDKLISGAWQGIKFFGSSSSDILKGFNELIKGADYIYLANLGNVTLKVGLGITAVSFLLWFFSLFAPFLGGFKWVMLGGVLTCAEGLVFLGMYTDKSRELKKELMSGYEEGSVSSFDNMEFGSDILDSGSDDYEDFEDDDSGWGNWGEDDEEDDDSFEEISSFGGGSVWNNISFGDEEEESVSTPSKYQEDINIDSAIDSIREIPAHTQTRQYLYEEYAKVLPLVNPDFSELKKVSENSDNFISFDSILRDAALQVGVKEEKLPELLELRENQFIIQLKATRPTGLKDEEAIANEIANIYSRDDFGGIIYEGVYATTSSVGANLIINIFKGENSTVTLADTYRDVGDYVLDPTVKKPIVIGVNELGRVWKFDAEKVYSYIFSGKPRTGKSWTVVSLVLQLCMYNSPKEVVFEAFDVKGTSSDFNSMKEHLPHFLKFESNPQKILSRLRHLTTVEANRRNKILEEYGEINIADLKSKNVDVDLPYCYVIIDEMIGLKNKLSKEEDNEFKELVNTLVTQLPNLGFRVILIPHRVTNDVIPKTTYTLVGCVACVKSDFKEISTTLEVNKKDFPYNLPNVGDMALKMSEINRGKTVFSHGIAITSSNEKNIDIYRFVGALWRKLEPDFGKVEEKPLRNTNSYKGHDLIDVMVEDDFVADSGDDEEDFWKDILG